MTTKKAAHEAGSRAAGAGIEYGENPYISEADADLRLAWSQGHNDYRVNKARRGKGRSICLVMA
jgi:hypothetical protein